MLPLSEKERSFVSQPLYQPADQLILSPAAVPLSRTPVLRETVSADDIVERSMKTRS